MRKLICYGLLVSLVFLSCTKTDVSDNQIASGKNDLPFGQFIMNEIAKARNFFETQIEPSASQKFKKTPIWDRASYAKMKSGSEKILVPLKYDKEYSFKTNFSGDKKLSLEKQSFLSIYEDVSGNYQAEVVTTYPDESFLNNMSQPFQGLLTIDDWNENRIKTDLHKDGNVYKLEDPHFNSSDNSTQISGRINEICMTVYWFWCEGWESNLSQCQYIGYTTYESCADYMSLQPPGEEGEYVYEYAQSKPWKWQVAVSPTFWRSESWETVSGVVGGLTHCYGLFGPQGNLSGISHSNSYLTFGQGFTWTENGNTVSKNSECEVQSWTSGKVTINSTGMWTPYESNKILSYQAWLNL